MEVEEFSERRRKRKSFPLVFFWLSKKPPGMMKWMGMVYNEMHPGISSADILLSSSPTELTPHCIQGLEDNLTLRILEEEKKPKTKYHRQILSKSSSSASLLSLSSL